MTQLEHILIGVVVLVTVFGILGILLYRDEARMWRRLYNMGQKETRYWFEEYLDLFDRS